MAKGGKWKEAEPSLLEIYSKKSPEEKKKFMETASPDELKQLVTERAKAKIKEGNRKLQELKAAERKKDTRELILLGALFKKLLLATPQMFNIVFPNIEQEISELTEIIKVNQSEIDDIKNKFSEEELEHNKEYKTLKRELSKNKKMLNDNEIIISALKALKESAAAHIDEDSDQSDSKDIPESTPDLDQES